MTNEASLRSEGEEMLFGFDLADLKEQTVDFGGAPQDNNNDNDAAADTITLLRAQEHIQRLLQTRDFSLDSPAQEKDFDKLFEWATDKGAVLSSIRYGRDEHGGRGLFAIHAVPKGGILASLPRNLRLGQKLACQRIPCLSSNVPDLTALSFLLLDFVGKDDDEWRLYVETLPRRHEFTNAMFMTKEDIQKWTCFGEEYAAAIQNVRAKADACVSYIRDLTGGDEPIADESAIRWAIAMVLSRSHAFGSQTGRWLTPVFDLANHSAENGARLEVDDQGGLLLIAGKDLASGEEVTLDYQEDKDENLVATYGFSLYHS